MAQQNNDDVARALAALAGGAVPSEHETPSGGIPSESIAFAPSPEVPQADNGAGEAPLFAPNAIPAGTLSPSRGTASLRAPVKPTPSQNLPKAAAATATDKPAKLRSPVAAPTTPALPPVPPMPTLPPVATVRQSSTSKRPAAPSRPSAPVPRSITTLPPSAPEAIENVVPSGDLLSEITEDDEVIAPAPDLSAFTPKVRPVVSKTRLYEQTNFRRTIIPILLTGGVMLIVLGAWSQIDRAGMLGGLGVGLGILFISLGVALLGMGVLNVFQVKHILEANDIAK